MEGFMWNSQLGTFFQTWEDAGGRGTATLW